MHSTRRRLGVSILLSVAAGLSLAGCGGSGGDPMVTGPGAVGQVSLPQVTNDFAAFANGASFGIRGPAVVTQGAGAAENSVNFTARPAANGRDIVLTSVGRESTLIRQANGTYALSESGSTLGIASALTDHAGVFFILLDDPASASSLGAFGTVGTPTSLADLGVQSGAAIYLGPSAFLSAVPGRGLTGGSGGFVFLVDFDRASVDGDIALTETQNSTQFRLSLRGAPISGNGFSGPLTQSGLNGTVTASNLDARFHGPGAAELGGTYSLTLNANGTVTYAAGALLGSRQTGLDVDALIAAAQSAAQSAAQGGSGGGGAGTAIPLPNGQTITLGSGSLIGGSGSVYPNGASTYYNSNTGASFGADGGGCYYVGDWSNC